MAKGSRIVLGEVQVGTDSTVARLHGDLDLASVDDLRVLLASVTESTSARVVVDLADVPFVDVLSLSVIMGAADGLRESGRQLVVEGASNAVRRMCALLNAEDILAPQITLPPDSINLPE